MILTQFYFVFLASIFQTEGMFKPIFCVLLVRSFCAHFCEDFRCADIGAQIFVQKFRRFFFDVFAIGVPESRKNEQKFCGRICSVPPGWVTEKMNPILGKRPCKLRKESNSTKFKQILGKHQNKIHEKMNPIQTLFLQISLALRK